jgi:hypothetical protein
MLTPELRKYIAMLNEEVTVTMTRDEWEDVKSALITHRMELAQLSLESGYRRIKLIATKLEGQL